LREGEEGEANFVEEGEANFTLIPQVSNQKNFFLILITIGDMGGI